MEAAVYVMLIFVAAILGVIIGILVALIRR